MPSQSSLTGAAGQYYVLCQLLRHDLIAALAPEGVPNTDIIVTDIEGCRQFAIQVKTRRDIGSDHGWHMKKKHEDIISSTLYYCFVDMGKRKTDTPVTYILPSSLVASVIKQAHQIWLSQIGRNGRKHKDHDMRRLLPDYSRTLRLTAVQKKQIGAGWMEKYRENWKIFS